MHERPSVFLVDDDGDAREMIRLLVQSVGLAVETFANAEVFLKCFKPNCVGCLVLDVRMPVMSGLQLQKRLVARGVRMPIIMLSGAADVPMAVEAMKAGAFDFIEKPFRPQRLLDAIQQAVAQDVESGRLRAQSNDIQRRLAELTRRERQVLDLVVAGKTSNAIASELGIQRKTVELYRSRVNRTMRARNAAELVRMVHCVDSIGTGEEQTGWRAHGEEIHERA
jgi:FixJ family two-component response regulator